MFSRSLSELSSEQKSEVTYLGVGGGDHLIVCTAKLPSSSSSVDLLLPLPPPAKYLSLGILEWDP